jgi:hypothetical protein
MPLNLLASKTVRYKVSDADEVVIGPMKVARTVRILADTMVLLDTTQDGRKEDKRDDGYPLVDFSPETFTIPAGHYLHILGAEEGHVWVTEI